MKLLYTLVDIFSLFPGSATLCRKDGYCLDFFSGKMLIVHFTFRKERRDQGLSVVIDSRRQQPVPALLSSLSELQVSQDLIICNYLPAHTRRISSLS